MKWPKIKKQDKHPPVFNRLCQQVHHTYLERGVRHDWCRCNGDHGLETGYPVSIKPGSNGPGFFRRFN